MKISMYLVILLAEFLNFKRDCCDWNYCYKFGKIYMYSDFIIKDRLRISFHELFYIYAYCLFFYCIMLIQIPTTIIFFIFNIFIKLNVEKKGCISNIFIYTPFLISKTLKVLVKNINKRFILVLTVNVINIYMWGFPRLTMNYAYVCFEIIKSYKNDPDKVDAIKVYEVLNCIYDNTWEKTIIKLEKINTL